MAVAVGVPVSVILIAVLSGIGLYLCFSQLRKRHREMRFMRVAFRKMDDEDEDEEN